MKSFKSVARLLTWVSLLVPVCAMAQIPNIVRRRTIRRRCPFKGDIGKLFVPRGWRESLGAPAGSEQLYIKTVATSCRSCHFNRELSLDFGTVGNFNQESDLLQYV